MSNLIILYIFFVGLATNIKWIIKFIRFFFKELLGFEKQVHTDTTSTNQSNQRKTITQFPQKTFNNEKNKYYESAYFFAKRDSYTEVINDTGKYGEYLIYDYLKDYQKSDGKFLFNCYIPRDNDLTTEIDVMLIHHSGIFVFESKNYSGWIFGNEKADCWTQTLPVKKGVAHKERFFNPVKQNNLHIECLKKIIGNDIPIYSIIVFSERCTLKDVSANTPNIYIIKRNQIGMTVSGILLYNQEKLDKNEIDDLYQKLYPYTQVSEEVKRKHIENLNKTIMDHPL